MSAADDSDANILLETVCDYLAMATVNAFNLYDIEKVLLVGSDFAGAADPLIAKINQKAAERVFVRDRAGDTLVIEGSTAGSCRTGATAILYSIFCERE